MDPAHHVRLDILFYEGSALDKASEDGRAKCRTGEIQLEGCEWFLKISLSSRTTWHYVLDVTLIIEISIRYWVCIKRLLVSDAREWRLVAKMIRLSSVLHIRHMGRPDGNPNDRPHGGCIMVMGAYTAAQDSRQHVNVVSKTPAYLCWAVDTALWAVGWTVFRGQRSERQRTATTWMDVLAVKGWVVHRWAIRVFCCSLRNVADTMTGSISPILAIAHVPFAHDSHFWTRTIQLHKKSFATPLAHTNMPDISMCSPYLRWIIEFLTTYIRYRKRRTGVSLQSTGGQEYRICPYSKRDSCFGSSRTSSESSP